MSPKYSSRRSTLIVAAFAVAALACADGTPTTTPIPDKLPGLQRTEANDSGGAGGPFDTTSVAPDPSAPGYVLGTVLGPTEQNVPFEDTIATAPRIAGVVVTAHPRVAPSPGDTIGVGPAVATVTTGADGKFQLPTLPGGEYIVTFVPPENSGYGGVWVWGPIHDQSHEWPWWVVLWKKKP